MYSNSILSKEHFMKDKTHFILIVFKQINKYIFETKMSTKKITKQTKYKIYINTFHFSCLLFHSRVKQLILKKGAMMYVEV